MAAETFNLYDKTENQISDLTVNYSRVLPPSASLNPKEVKRIKKEFKYLKQACVSINNNLELLENSLDVSGLINNFQPLMVRLGRFEETMEVCQQFSTLQSKINNETNEVKEAIKALAKQILPYNLPRFEEGLEQFLDRCDLIADELDALDAKGHKISDLEKPYETWILLIEQFRELLDERTEALIVKP